MSFSNEYYEIECSKSKKEKCIGKIVYSFMDNCFRIFQRKTDESIEKRGKFCKKYNSIYLHQQFTFGNHLQYLLSHENFVFLFQPNLTLIF